MAHVCLDDILEDSIGTDTKTNKIVDRGGKINDQLAETDKNKVKEKVKSKK